MPVQTWSVGQVLTSAEMKTITDMIPYYSAVSASTNPCVAGTFYNVDASGAAKTMTLPASTIGACIGIKAKSTAGGVITITTAAGVIRGPGCGSAGSASMTLGAEGAYVVIMSDGTDWHVIQGQFDSGWITPSFSNSWVGVKYRLIGNFVKFSGEFISGTTATTAFTLPAGYRPTALRAFPSVDNSGVYTTAPLITITSAGVVTVTGTNGVYADSVSFTVD